MKIQAVIFDWAGTMVDFGCCAPVGAVQAAFAQFGIMLSEADARRPMGLLKRDHIATIFGYASISAEWKAQHGNEPGEYEIDRVHDAFLELQQKLLSKHAELIPDGLDAIERLRSRNIRIGSTTGYTRAMLAPVAEAAARQGYRPDASVTPDEAGIGRPAPFMILQNLVRLGVWPPSAVIKVGDTPVDIQEGLNAGVWSVGVAATGNGIGLPLAEFRALSADEQKKKILAARQELEASGAHFVIDSMRELDGIIAQIESEREPAGISFAPRIV
jgi:phosphonoacetaldehyde hydrolase